MSPLVTDPTTILDAPPAAVRGSTILHRWPSALGLAAAGLLLATGAANRHTLAIAVSAAAACYLAAAALSRPWVAWASIAAVPVVVVAGEIVGLAWWVGMGLAASVLVAVGLHRGASRPTLTQGAAFAGFGALAVVALALDPDAGLVLAGLALAGHAVWDVVHHRRDEVVPRSLAEACIWLDVPLGLGCIALALVA